MEADAAYIQSGKTLSAKAGGPPPFLPKNHPEYRKSRLTMTRVFEAGLRHHRRPPPPPPVEKEAGVEIYSQTTPTTGRRRRSGGGDPVQEALKVVKEVVKDAAELAMQIAE